MPFSAMQQEYFMNATHRWNVKTGATRSGKTYMDYFVIPKRIIACKGRGLIVLIGNTKSTLERNILTPMRNLYGPRMIGLASPNSGAVKLFGRKCFALGADKVSQVSKLQGAGIEYAYGDEITTWHPDVFQMLKSRLDKPNSCFDGTCNPDSSHHWFKSFLDAPGIDLYKQAYTIDDNPFLSPDFVAALKQEYAGTVYYKRFILGQWAAAEGAVYPLFAADSARYIVDEPPDDIAYAIIGLDFGGTGSANTINLTGISRDMRRICTLDEFYLKERITPTEFEDHFVGFVMRAQKRYRVYEAYMDSAEQTMIAGMQVAALRARLPIDIKNAQKRPIHERIRFYNRLMGAERYTIMRHCKHTIDAFESAVFDPKKPRDERLDDGTYNVDSLDAQEYSTESVMNDIIMLS